MLAIVIVRVEIRDKHNDEDVKYAQEIFAGTGTDSTWQGNSMWSRIKAKQKTL